MGCVVHDDTQLTLFAGCRRLQRMDTMCHIRLKDGEAIVKASESSVN